MESDELTVAKINATVKILEWAKDGIEPGIGGSPQELHSALASAFKAVYHAVSETITSENAGGGQRPSEKAA
jgi:hypothetical protein